MSDIAIKVENLVKAYKLYSSPRERLKESVNPFGKKYHRNFSALNDVSFEVKKGETVGIIGKNGCGKSTLLKVITGVLSPTNGSVAVNGKVSALLELGAGFNPELTGLENIYFNGTILGYTRAEIDERLSGILSFADIGEFVHQKVKTYSSGMFVRLAFSIAITVDPDILIIDEALSVGDEAFQRKCYSRIMDFQKKGKTILFVSHSAAAMIELCNRAILFDGGELLMVGAPKIVVAKYHRLLYAVPEKQATIREELKQLYAQIYTAPNTAGGTKRDDRAANGNKASSRPLYDPNLVPKSTSAYESRGALISNPIIKTLRDEQVNVLVRGEEYQYSYTVHFQNDAFNVRFGMLIKTTTGYELGGLISHTPADAIEFVPKGTVLHPTFRFRCALLPGAYFLNSGLVGTINGTECSLHRIIDIAMFRVQPERDLYVNGFIDFTASSVIERGGNSGCVVLGA